MRCLAHEITDTTPAVSVAEMTCTPSGNRVGLCQRHLDMWFDNADDEPDLEPASVRWLDGSRILTDHPLGVRPAEQGSEHELNELLYAFVAYPSSLETI